MGSTKAESSRMLARMKKKRVSEWYQQSPPSEMPAHRVRITKPFYLRVFEVRLGDFRRFVAATKFRTDAERDGQGGDGKLDGKWTTRPEFSWNDMGFERSEDFPVVNVTWSDAVAFCGWLSETEKKHCRLPTEAEWEYACRAGMAMPLFWGNDESKRDEFAWSRGNSRGTPHPVGQLKPNAWGLYDINGNAYEYCSDWFSTNYYASFGNSIAIDPQGPTSGTERVVRSGSWGTDPMHCRPAFRGGGGGAVHRNMRDGFRVVLEMKLR